MATPAYMETNNADLVKLIKDGAIFIREVGATAPTGPEWVPGAEDAKVGYYSEDGFTLAPAPGDETTFTAHNGDDVHSEQAPGHWTLAFAGLEANEANAEAYFDTEVGADGSVTVTTAAASKYYDIVTVGLDQNDGLVLAHYPRVKINGREGIQFNRTNLLAYNMTFRTFKGDATAPYHFKAWGMAPVPPVTP